MFDVERFPLQAGFNVHLFQSFFNDQTDRLINQRRRSNVTYLRLRFYIQCLRGHRSTDKGLVTEKNRANSIRKLTYRIFFMICQMFPFYENPAEYPAIHGGDECGQGSKGMESPSLPFKMPRLLRRGASLKNVDLFKTIYKDGRWTLDELLNIVPRALTNEVINPAPSQVPKS